MYTSYSFFVETDVPSSELIISRTDLSGKITYANEVFANISGYSVDELVGQPHSIVRHPDMPKSVFANLWETIKSGKNWSGYVKNLRKDKGYYWVYADISQVFKDGKLVEYKSLRAPVSEEDKVFYQNKYDQMRKEEENSCRLVVNISAKNLEKLEKFAKDTHIEENKIFDKILEDYLL